MNFAIDKDNKKIHVDRTFEAPVSSVWDAWTKSEILDKWWAPKPWKARTKFMAFKQGGHWLYAMVGPEGEEHWARFDYSEIVPQESFSGMDAFCDEHGVINDAFGRSFWKNSFIETSGKTQVSVEIAFNSVADMEQQLEMGFQEGFTTAMNGLDEIL